MGKPSLSKAATNLHRAVDAEGGVVLISIRASGRRVVHREALGGAVSALPRTIEKVVQELSGSHAATKRIFTEVEETFEKVLSRPSPIKTQQARLTMDSLDTQWREAREELKKLLATRGRADHGLGATQADERAVEAIRQLDDLFNSRYGFTNFLSLMPYDKPPAEFRRLIRQELAKSTSSPAVLDDITAWASSLPFLKRPSLPPTKSPARGHELLAEVRRLQSEATPAGKPGQPSKSKFGPGPAKPPKQPKGKGAPKPDPTAAAKQMRALDELMRFHPEHDVMYDDVVDVVDARFAAQRTSLGPTSVADAEFVDDVVNNVQGRIAETLALRHPEFKTEVWKRAQRTANDLSARLNAKLPPGARSAERWSVEIVTEPTFAMRPDGRGGELMDSGVWLVRSGPGGNEAMPVFGLEVKSGELRGSIGQQIMDRVRVKGGLVQLPGSNRTYKMTLPLKYEFQTALSSTRNITDKRLLGQLEEEGEAAAQALVAGERLHTFKLPMRRTDLRAAATALVTARLNQLKRGLK